MRWIAHWLQLWTWCLTIPTYRRWQYVFLEVTSKFNSSCANSCVQPGIQYFNERLRESIQILLAAFKAAQLSSLLQIQEIQRDCAAVDSLSLFLFLDHNRLGNLKSELPQYMAAVEDISQTYSPLEFWKTHAHSLPAWATAAQTLQCSSAITLCFWMCFLPPEQFLWSPATHALQDYCKTSLMLHYNKC